MERLPLELSLKICDHLDLVDLMALRLVCKKFEQIVKRVTIRELVFVNAQKFWTSSAYGTNKSWLPMNVAKEFGAIFNFSKYLLSSSFFSGGPFDVRFLKRLSIRSLREVKGIDFEDLNRFGQLEQLEIGFDQRPRRSSSMWSLFDQQERKVPRLFLPNLKVLNIVSYFNQHGLVIDARRLKALKLPQLLKATDERESYVSYDPERMQDAQRNFASFLNRSTNDLSSLRFEHPGSVELLQVPDLCAYFGSHESKFEFRTGIPNSDPELIALDPDEFRQSEFDYFRYLNYIERFRNVEHIFLDQFFRLSEFYANLIGYLVSVISKMPNLKRLNLRSDRPFDSFRVPEFTRLLQWIAIRRPELKICHMGLEFSNGRRLFDDFRSYQDACAKELRKLSLTESECSHWVSSYKLALQLKNSSFLDKRRSIDVEIIYSKLLYVIQTIQVAEGAATARSGSGLMNRLLDAFFEMKITYINLMHVIRTMQVDNVPEFRAATARSGSGLMNLLPDVFFEMKITCIRATKSVENEADFTHLVESCKSLKELILKGSGLSQRFFDELPAICLLNFLVIFELKRLSMHFLLRMNRLIECSTNQRMAPELVLKLVKRKYCRTLYCRIKGSFVGIGRNGRDEFLYGSFHWTLLKSVSFWSLVGSDSSYTMLSFESLAEHLERQENRFWVSSASEFWTLFTLLTPGLYQLKSDIVSHPGKTASAFQIYLSCIEAALKCN